MRTFFHPLFGLLGVVILLSACQKKPAPDNSNVTASADQTAASATAPTGIVKNAIRHTEETADVTKWMEMASSKTPAQLAEEARLAKIAKDTKLEQEAKLALDAKTLAAKTTVIPPVAPLVHDPVKTTAAAVTPPATATAIKQADAPPLQVAAVLPKPVPAVVATPTPAQSQVQTQENTEQNQPKLLSSVQPTFPVTATLAGVTEGSVTTRISIGSDGKVLQVEIVKARPTKVFDKEAIAALSQWRYAPLASPQTKIVELSFQNVLKLLTSVQPLFPAAATQAGVTEGLVSARISIGTDGKVSQVEIIKSKPTKLFDKEVIAAASQWKYAPISSPQTKILEFSLKQSN
ncbi:protein TonB [Undibacterium sp. GrIS 1.2]|uniref:energy transducer TonB n=1 Tax=Undibacterium sp. GrIS 1.2 TaxID=3143933 RepID=UPI003397669C